MERSGSSRSSGSTGISGDTGIHGIRGIPGISGRAAPPGAVGRALLCLVLVLVVLPPGQALPTPEWAPPRPPHTDPLAGALNRSRDLLEATETSLHRLQELGTLGFECILEEVDPKDITKNQINTIRACMSEDPRTGNCPTLEKSTFDKNKCLQGIYEDLRTYRAELKNCEDEKLLTTLDEMMQALNGSSRSVPEPLEDAVLDLSFWERLQLCRVLQVLRIRSITITRILNHLSSLENTF